MRSVILALLLGCSLPSIRADDAAYASALARHVGSGGVDYAEWKASTKDRDALIAFTEVAASKDIKSISREERLAFLINAYNAWMMRIVIEHYPIRSVKDIAPDFGVFDQKRIKVAGKKLSLNELEKEWLLKGFQEPRVHFAVNCASRSCPPLKATLWTSNGLDGQFDSAAKAYLTANPLGFDASSGKVSQIFEWYAADFGGADGVRAFIKNYRKPPAKLTFLTYDWTLNAIK
jgi:hypothetical protein